ncbi:zinc finger matrin-type protein CG9776 isoform X3 [Drosophila biarmipes]|uniref:zinc finger matrin-type protein CG9776 isoform X3 n=1 Tax=Drosophila biarmipes TaxID=125945 RepID=UPI0007E7A3DB|nr:zinc finger matrin-type protein CG9776 isoform X3 [Drosophila biarmipes]
MDEDSGSRQPVDRRLENAVDLPPGPPGVDGNEKSDSRGIASGKGPKSSFKHRGRTDSRNAASPLSTRRRRSASRSPTPPRRGRYDSPDYGRYPRRRFDRDRHRHRSPPPRRYGRSRSRTVSPRRGSRWSPKRKPASPPLPPPQGGPTQQMAPGYGVMVPQMYAPYGAPPDVYGHQYGMPPNAFPSQGPGYGMPGPSPEQATFGAGYGPPPTGAWGVNEYGQQVWLTQAMAGVQASASDALAQPQQATESLPVKHLEEEQKRPALDGAGLPPQDAAVAQEAEKQKDELKKQRANYVKKVTLLKKEMKVLRDQREDLAAGEAPPSPTTKNFIEENDRLQIQIKKKLDTIENVIDMLNGIIGYEDLEDEPSKPKVHGKNQAGQQGSRSQSSSDSSADSSDSSSSSGSSSASSSDGGDEEETIGAVVSPTNQLKHRAMKSMKTNQRHGETQPVPAPTQNYNFVFFDPEQHWCESCSVFPRSARDYLKHLHAEEHMNRETIETPWHMGIDHDPFPTFENAPVKRVPVRGMQFLVPANAWYCKLCSVWIGDLHCASAHLKSRLHSNKYEQFINQNPKYELEWQANRERAMNQQREQDDSKTKKNTKDEDKASKKRKKKSGERKKKKRKHGKKSKKSTNDANSTSSSSNSSSSEDDKAQPPKKGRIEEPINAASIRVAMRKQETLPTSVKPQEPLQSLAPPPPPIIKDSINASGSGKWSSASGEVQKEDQKKRDEAMLKQWNTVQPVISESEKKLFEQLKGKLKNKGPRDSEDGKLIPHAPFESEGKLKRSGGRRSRSRSKRRSHSRSISRGRDRDRRDRERDRDRSYRRRSRSRNRYFSRSPLRSSRRSRSRDGRNRRSRSRSADRIERPVIKHSEFRPRTVPERKQSETKRDKKDAESKSKTSKPISNSLSGGKKLPFIGKMPVFKKQPVAASNYDAVSIYTNGCLEAPPPPPPPIGGATVRQPAPTAAQIQMAMMEDAFGNAPPFHPDAGMMVDYDELMPDPVQFANLMTSCPPPPPPGEGSDGEPNDPEDREQHEKENHAKEVLPPGIDEAESDLGTREHAEEQPRDGRLPKDLAEALDIIFPSEGTSLEASNEKKEKQSEPQTITTIVEDDAVLSEHNLQDLAKQGIHLVTIDETEASNNSTIRTSKKNEESQLLNGENTAKIRDMDAEDIPMPSSPPAIAQVDDEAKIKALKIQAHISDIPKPPASPSDSEKLRRQAELDELAMLGIDSSDMAAQCM